jgi:hypothetical protein
LNLISNRGLDVETAARYVDLISAPLADCSTFRSSLLFASMYKGTQNLISL